jgi:SAM-dependent methyltransferase
MASHSRAFSHRYTRGDYLEQVPDWHAGDAAWKASKVFEMLERHDLAPKSLCDVGCGAGEILARLSARMSPQLRFAGYDISPQAIALAKTREAPNLAFHQADFLEQSSEVFDVVLLLDVLEHVPDYLGFLGRLRAHGRYFIFHIPLDLNAQSVVARSRYMLEMRREFGHLHYFTSETARATLVDTGYTLLDSFYTWDHETEVLGPLEALRHPVRGGMRLFDRALFGLKPELAASLRPHFNLLVLAEAAAAAPDSSARQRSVSSNAERGGSP